MSNRAGIMKTKGRWFPQPIPTTLPRRLIRAGAESLSVGARAELLMAALSERGLTAEANVIQALRNELVDYRSEVYRLTGSIELAPRTGG